MRTLIVYYSFTENNEKLANELKDRIVSDIYKIREERKRKTISILLDVIFHRQPKLLHHPIDIKAYDYVIFIAPIWGGKMATPMSVFLHKVKDSIVNNYYFITLCNGGEGQPEKIANELYSILQQKPLKVIELSINSLLPKNQQNKIRNTFNFRMNQEDFILFVPILEPIIQKINDAHPIKNG